MKNTASNVEALFFYLNIFVLSFLLVFKIYDLTMIRLWCA